MDGLYYQLEKGLNITLYILHFYKVCAFAIYRKLTGIKAAYFKKELANFMMEGTSVKAEPEYTFCGSIIESINSISFKFENEIMGHNVNWDCKDVLSFKGKINPDGSFLLTKQVKGVF